MSASDIGEATRKIVCDACKHLFYEKGYHETTYSNISEYSGVNRGAVYYHFKSKSNIAAIIQKEIYQERIAKLKELFPEESHEVIELISFNIFWHCIASDRPFRRFFCESTPEVSDHIPPSNYLRHYGYAFPDSRISELNATVSIGVNCSLFKYADQHIEDFSSPEDITYYLLSVHSKLFGSVRDERLLEKANALFRSLDIAIGDAFELRLRFRGA